MKNAPRQELSDLHERMTFFVKRAKINSYLPLFFLVSALLYAGFLYLCEVEFLPVTHPGIPARAYYIGSENRHMLIGLRNRSALKQNFPAWADPAHSAHEYVRLESNSAPSLRPLPPMQAFPSLAYSQQEPNLLPPVSFDPGDPDEVPAARALPMLEGTPYAWGPLKQEPSAGGEADPGWIGRRAAFLVLLGNNGSPEQTNLIESSGDPEADRAAAAFLRTARWAISQTPRSALIAVEWKEALP